MQIRRSLLSAAAITFDNSDVFANEVAGNYPALKRSRQHGARRLQPEVICSAPPAEGCGFGIWDDASCKCKCIPPYCFDDIFQACTTPGSCANDFEGCTPYVDCPYFPNPMGGNCESGPTIAASVYSIYWTNQDCCSASYSDVEYCLRTEPPTTSPPSTPAITANPTVPPSKPGMAEPTVDTAFDTVGVSLEPIPLKFYNLPDQFEYNDERREELKEIIWDILTPISDVYNATILSLGIVGNIFAMRDTSLSLELLIEVTGEAMQPMGISDAFQEALQDRVYNIADAVKNAWGNEAYADNVLLSIGDAQTTLSPSPATLNGAATIPSTPKGTDSSSTVPTWAIALCSVAIVLLCCGVLAWQWRRDKDTDRAVRGHSSYFDEERSHAPANDPNSLLHFSTPEDLNYDRGSQISIDLQGGTDEQSQSQTSFFNDRSVIMDPSSNNMMSSSGMQGNNGLDPSCSTLDSGYFAQVGIDESFSVKEDQNEPPKRRSDEEQEKEEKGYDGGNSSSFINTSVSEDSSDHGVDVDESSTEHGNVLGLLYYDGASSAGESQGKESSARSRRTRRSHRSGGTRRSSGGNSKSKSSTSRMSIARKKNAETLRKVEEERGSQRQRDPDGYHGNDVAHEVQPSTASRRADLSGSIVYANVRQEGNLDGIQEKSSTGRYGDRSFFSHGSTIRTDDSHRRAYSSSHGSSQDEDMDCV